jgi:electron transfer flavoprotein beta subunit
MEGLNIVVLVKVVPKSDDVKMNPETNTLDRRDAESIINPPDKNAVETAVALKEQYGGKVTLMSMAPPFVDDFMRLMMAMGADDAILLSDRAFAMADTYPTNMVIAEGIKKMGNVDLVICGTESADGGTGNVPPGVAEFLNFSQATYVEEVDYEAEQERFVVKRATTNGFEIISIPKPALLSIELGVNSPRFPNFELKKELDSNYQLTIWDNKELGLDPDKIGLAGSLTIVDGMVQGKSRERKRIILDGSSDEIAEKLAELIIENM